MAEEDKSFRFITATEFTQLTQKEKMEYLDRAVSALKSRGEGFRLFADSDATPRKEHN